ncbi:hypothetical protein D3C84_1114650 [compost metagenome]
MRRLRGSGMPTISSSSSVRAVASLPVRPLCSRRISLICFSMLCSGFSEVIGSWKIIAMRLPRMRCMVFSFCCSRSLPS